ncbi:DUF1254 domain-containing protein [Novosphingobium sp. ZW T3_23]|uniref:DUF1254 domain-containing protein n=1 Tax=Novosphingobium sp. ZW T3_23 TaxID=3378084 RepID=UPI0038524E9A
MPLIVPPVSRNFPSPPVSGTRLPKAYVETIGRFAFVWGWPLVNMHNRRVVFSKVPESGLGDGVLPIAPLNRLTMLTHYIDPDERAVATPNQDVAYGFGIFSLEKEPTVFQVPDFGDRFWLYQLGDHRTDTLGGCGKMYGTRPGFYLVAGPDWQGVVPKGIAGVYRSPTNLAYVCPRCFLDDTDADRAAIVPVVGQVMAYPLSEYDGSIKSKDWTDLPTIGDPAGGSQGSGGETQWVKPEGFFTELPAILDEVPPMPGEEALYAQFRALLDAAAADQKIADTLRQVAIDTDRDIVQVIHDYNYAGVPVANGWVAPVNGAEFGCDYFSRAAAAKANIFVNPRREAAYFSQEADANGERLHGANSYSLTFAENGLPPVDGFWSLTLYDEAHFFAPNELKRFSLGTKNKDLKFGADRSLTIYVQHARPDEDKVSNWLPAPEAAFELFLRAYWPGAAILDDSWAAPPVVKHG